MPAPSHQPVASSMLNSTVEQTWPCSTFFHRLVTMNDIYQDVSLSTKDAVDPILGMASLTIVEAPGKPMSADLRLSPSMKKKR